MKTQKKKRLSVQTSTAVKPNAIDPKFEVQFAATEQELLELMNAHQWKKCVRAFLHSLMDWRDCSERPEATHYDHVIQHLRDEMADYGLSIIDPEVLEEGSRRARDYWENMIVQKYQTDDKAQEGKCVQKLISSGDTEGSKAALDFALNHGFSHGGWCLAGKPSEDTLLDGRYRLSEMPEATEKQVIGRNIVESDATVIITAGAELGSRSGIVRVANKHKKPILHISTLGDGPNAARLFRQFLRENSPRVLNVIALASREDTNAGVIVQDLLAGALLEERNTV